MLIYEENFGPDRTLLKTRTT